MAEPLTTRILIEQVQGGDDDALQELFCRYEGRVLAAVRLRLGSGLRKKLESWDVVQEVFIDALRQVNSFEFKTEGAFLHYLNKVVSNKIRDEADHWKTQKHDVGKEAPLENLRSPESENPLDRLEDHAVRTPSMIVGLREDLAMLERAMDRLGEESEEYRDLIIAVKLEGKTYAEIAESKAVSVDAVRMQVRRAVLALTKIAAGQEGGR